MTGLTPLILILFLTLILFLACYTILRHADKTVLLSE